MSVEPSRHVSPDGRTILFRTSDFHPADAHEIRELFFPRVVDAASGATLLDLSGGVTSFDFAWEEGGALMLIGAGAPYPEPDPLRIRISVAGGWYEINRDGWTRRPLAEAQTHIEPLARRGNYLPADRGAAPSRALGLAKGAAWLAGIGAVLWFIFFF